MTLAELIQRMRDDINARIAEYNDKTRALNELRAADEPDEAEITVLTDERALVESKIGVLKGRLKDLEAEAVRDQAIQELLSEPLTLTDAGRALAAARAGVETVSTVRVTEARTYTRETDPKGDMFLRDVVADYLNMRGDGALRLTRHMQEEMSLRGQAITREERAVSTGGAPGLVVPQYLVDLYAAKGRPGRHFADQCRHHDLPETGMTVYIPRQIAKTSVGIQAAENTAVSETDYADELISVPVRTAAGSQTVSRQVAERSLGTLDITFEDLMRAYDTDLDNQLLNAASWGLLAVSNVIAYTDASPTFAGLYGKILQGISLSEDTMQDLSDDDFLVLSRGRRWAWMKNQWSPNRLVIQPGGGGPGIGGVDDQVSYADGRRGSLPDGTAVVTDNNLPANLGAGTNQDPVIVVARREAHLWEDPASPIFVRAEQTQAKKLGIDLVLYGYYAGLFNRVVDDQGSPKSVHQAIYGTGTIAPTF